MFEIHVHILVLVPFLSFTCMMIMVVFTIVNKLTEKILDVNINILNVNKSMCIKNKIQKWYNRKSRQKNETTIRQKLLIDKS